MPNTHGAPDVSSPSGFPDRVADLFEAHGWPRLMGRVLAELMLAEPPFLSTAQLCERLGTSKGHLSSAITVLRTMGMIERFGVAGTRQRHYRLTSDAFVRAMHAAAEPSRIFADLAEQALGDVPTGTRAHDELTRMRDFYRFLARRFPEIVAEFEAQ